MKARIKAPVRLLHGTVLPEGHPCELIEEMVLYRLRVETPSGTDFITVDASRVAIPCEVPDCERDSTHSHPRHWCGEHWQLWFDCELPEEEEPAWMRINKNET